MSYPIVEQWAYDIQRELDRQHKKFGDQTQQGWKRWAVIAGEEMGEVCKAVLEDNPEELRKELIQLAAVCVNWVECMDRNAKG